MVEYIEKQKAIKLLDMCMVAAEKRWKEATNPLAKIEFKADKDTIEAMIEVVVSVPSADVQPVKRGRWDFQGYQLFKCTNCKEMFTQDQLEAMQNHINQEEFTFPNFCPNCGADMRDDTNE